MKTAYILRVSYDGEPRLWRTMLVPGNCSAFDLWAAILSAFDTCAYHLFHLQDDGAMYNVYEPDYADGRYDQRLLTEHIVDDLGLSEGSEMSLCYDYGLYQQFIIDCEQVTEVEGRSLLPRVLDGHGCGIMDDVDSDTLRQMIDRAERDGSFSLPYPAKRKKWIWNSFDADKVNAVLKREINRIRKGYLEDEDE